IDPVGRVARVGSGAGHRASAPPARASRRSRRPSLRFTSPDQTVSTTARAISARPIQRAGDHHTSKGIRQKVIAMVWTMVLALPARFAGSAPYFRIVNRMTVMPISRTRIRMVIHHGTYSHTESMISAAPVIALSAMGSMIFPKSVIRFRLRARWPSAKSVIIASTNTPATSRRPGTESASSAARTTSSGTIAHRTTVRMLAMFQSGTSAVRGAVIGGYWGGGDSASGEAPGVLAVLAGVVVVVDVRLGVARGQRVAAVAVVGAGGVIGLDRRARGEVDRLVRPVGRVAGVLLRHLLAADAGDGGAELVGVDEHVASLGPLGGTHDLPRLEQVHQTAGLREAH